jgi:hypothetical protein
MYPLVLDLAADSIPVAVTCRVLGFSKQAFYAWRKCPVTQRDGDDAHLINAAIDIHHDDPEFGYRFIADELAGKGVVASRNRVNRLCTMQKLWSAHSRKRGLNSGFGLIEPGVLLACVRVHPEPAHRHEEAEQADSKCRSHADVLAAGHAVLLPRAVIMWTYPATPSCTPRGKAPVLLSSCAPRCWSWLPARCRVR